VSRRILVVDDEESILFAIERYFTRHDYQVDCARELEEAEALLTNRTYAVVIADLRLTGINGVEGLQLISYVRAICSETRVVLLTGFGSPEIEAEAYRRGVHAFLHKPIALRDLEETIETLFAVEWGTSARREG